MNEILFMVSFVLLCAGSPCFAQTPSMGQIEKSQTDIEMDKSLRMEAEKGKKVLIKKIIVKGVTLITEDKLKEITLPFKNHWLAKEDINYILDSIVYAYRQKGHKYQPEKISHQIKKATLGIDIKELKH